MRVLTPGEIYQPPVEGLWFEGVPLDYKIDDGYDPYRYWSDSKGVFRTSLAKKVGGEKIFKIALSMCRELEGKDPERYRFEYPQMKAWIDDREEGIYRGTWCADVFYARWLTRSPTFA